MVAYSSPQPDKATVPAALPIKRGKEGRLQLKTITVKIKHNILSESNE
jgi:hypothetical protein